MYHIQWSYPVLYAHYAQPQQFECIHILGNTLYHTQPFECLHNLNVDYMQRAYTLLYAYYDYPQLFMHIM